MMKIAIEKKLKTNFPEKLENMVKISFSKTNNMICFLTLYSHWSIYIYILREFFYLYEKNGKTLIDFFKCDLKTKNL